MKKEYYNKQKANYINHRLRSTGINKVCLPLIIDVMLRRQFEYGLSDEMLDRDINTFIYNVEKIEITQLKPGTLGHFHAKDKAIRLNEQLFQGETIDFEKIYLIFTHECIHAISNEETIEGRKEDRIFNHYNFLFTIGAEEAFTECIADSQVYNREYNEFQKGPYISETIAYSDITPYIDVISLTFGVGKKELLSATVKGEVELNNLLNKSMNTRYENLRYNEIFFGIVTNLSLLNSSIERNEELNISRSEEDICNLAMIGINERLSNLEIDDIDNFRQKFEQIKLQAEISHILTGDKKIDNIFYDKLKCIDEVLESGDIECNVELLRKIQSVNSMDELMQLMEENNITIDSDARLTVEAEIIDEYNMGYSSNGMEWDNTQIISYIEKNQKKIINPKNNILDRMSTKFKSWITNLGRTDNEETKLLPGEIEGNNTEPKSWDLSNWGIDKEQFMQEHAIHMEEYANSIEEQPTIEQPVQEEGFTIHSGHEDGYSRGYD